MASFAAWVECSWVKRNSDTAIGVPGAKEGQATGGGGHTADAKQPGFPKNPIALNFGIDL